MLSKLTCAALSAWLLAGTLGHAQTSQKLNNLIVYGDGFAFAVKEPEGWHGDTDKIAAKYQVNVVFQSPMEPAAGDVTIRVRVNSKVDENTIEDLNYDMDGYKKQFSNVQFSNLSVVHPQYETFARTVFIPKKFYEYVAYLNPGPGKRVVLSVAMSKKGDPANDGEMKAFETVLKSVAWLSR